MKITINQDITNSEIEIVINCRNIDEQVARLIALLKADGDKLSGYLDGQTYIISPEKILYIDLADKKSFIYCEEAVYETPLRLYEIEEKLAVEGFVRASKSAIVNLRQVKSLRPDFGARLILKMNNGECIIASRQYAIAIKEKLGIK